MTTRTVSVALKAEVSGYVNNINKAAAATRSMADDAKRHVGTVATQLAGMSRGAQLVGAVGAIALGRQFVNAASSMNETMSKTRVVFGDASASVIDWSKSSARAMGLSQQQAEEAASTFGNLFVSMKIGQAPAASMSRQLVQLAGDLASFNNTDPTAALDALRSGLVGEVEPLRKYGVNLSEVTLKQKAMELGLVSTTTGVLPPAIRTQAAYALILEQTTTAQGDYARTADGLTNSQRTLNAEWANTQAQLGQQLLPLVNTGVKDLGQMLGVVNALPEPVRAVAVSAGVAGAAFLLLAPRAVDTLDAFRRIEDASPRAGNAIAGVASVAGKAAVALAALNLAGALHDSNQEINGGISNLSQFLATSVSAGRGLDQLGAKVGTLGQATDSFNEAISRAASPDWSDALGQGFHGLTGWTDDLTAAKASIDGVDQALAQLVSAGHADQAQAAFLRLRDAFIASGGRMSDFDAQFPQYRSALDGVAGSVDKVAGAADQAGYSIDYLRGRIDKVLGRSIDAKQRALQWRDALADLASTIDHNGRSLDANTAKGRANAETLLELVSRAKDNAQADLDAGVAKDKVAAKYAANITQIKEEARRLGLSKTAVDNLIGAYSKLPAEVTTTVVVPGAASALTLMQRINAEIRKMPGHAGVAIAVTKSGDLVGHGTRRAAGGPVDGPGTSTSDSIPLWASTGEWVMQAAARRQYGDGFMASVNAGTYRPDASSPRGFGGSGAESFTLTAPVAITLDGVTPIWQGLLRLKRGRGGIDLGLS